MQASSEAIRDMEKEIQLTIKNLQKCSEGILNANRATTNWDDDKAAEFNMLMGKVSRLVDSPVDTLQKALPKLEALAQAVDNYNKHSIS